MIVINHIYIYKYILHIYVKKIMHWHVNIYMKDTFYTDQLKIVKHL